VQQPLTLERNLLSLLCIHTRSLIYAKVYFYQKNSYEHEDEREFGEASEVFAVCHGMHCVHFSGDLVIF